MRKGWSPVQKGLSQRKPLPWHVRVGSPRARQSQSWQLSVVPCPFRHKRRTYAPACCVILHHVNNRPAFPSLLAQFRHHGPQGPACFFGYAGERMRDCSSKQQNPLIAGANSHRWRRYLELKDKTEERYHVYRQRCCEEGSDRPKVGGPCACVAKAPSVAGQPAGLQPAGSLNTFKLVHDVAMTGQGLSCFPCTLRGEAYTTPATLCCNRAERAAPRAQAGGCCAGCRRAVVSGGAWGA